MTSFNTIIQKMSARAGVLACTTITDLRSIHPDNVDGLKSFGMEIPKHRLISDILYDEFLADHDFDMDDPYKE